MVLMRGVTLHLLHRNYVSAAKQNKISFGAQLHTGSQWNVVDDEPLSFSVSADALGWKVLVTVPQGGRHLALLATAPQSRRLRHTGRWKQHG